LDANNELLDLMTIVPKLKLDIRYASTNNFVGKQFYSLPAVYARKPVALALSRAQNEFLELGYSLVIFDAYRPYSVTVAFYETYQDTNYVASPYSGSRHNRGAAIDLTLSRLSTGKLVEMGTEYDDFSEKAHPFYSQHSKEIIANRNLLISIMKKHGFEVYHSEWWHFDYETWEDYELLDLSFEQLKSNKKGRFN
jgi:D-alanyl-D-alanine dipeptidase